MIILKYNIILSYIEIGALIFLCDTKIMYKKFLFMFDYIISDYNLAFK